jgi:hypothetical protein
MTGVTAHDVDAELGIEGECHSLMVVPVAVGGSMGRRAVAAVRLAVDRDSETARECEYGHQDDRGERAAHEDTPLRRGIGRRVALLDAAAQWLAPRRPPERQPCPRAPRGVKGRGATQSSRAARPSASAALMVRAMVE